MIRVWRAMNTYNIPYEITGIILTKMNKSIKCLLDDEVILKFIIKYSNIHPETLLIWLVKQQRKKALVLYTTIRKQEVLHISENVFILLCKIAIKNSNVNIMKHLLNVFVDHLKQNRNVLDNILKLLIEVYVKTNCMKWLNFLKYLLSLPYHDYVINTVLLVKILEKDKSKKLIKIFLDTQSVIMHMLETEVINHVIINNHLSLLKTLVVNGYEISVYDIIICISTSNWKMNKYIIKYFKPRLYTKGFRKLLLSIAAKRNNKQIYEYVYQRISK